MKAGFRVRRATELDLDGIMRILLGRRTWLRETKLSDQWASVAEWRQLLVYLVRRGHVWILTTADEGRIVGTVTVSADPDRDFWERADRRVPALYVSKLATDVDWKGQELGQELLEWVRGLGRLRGAEVLRLDTWKTSRGLRHYYENRGWRHLGTVEIDRRQSGSLFERSTAGADIPPELAEPTSYLAVVSDEDNATHHGSRAARQLVEIRRSRRGRGAGRHRQPSTLNSVTTVIRSISSTVL